MAILEVKNLVVNYGAIRALKGISFYVNEGEIISLIGSNGAGKTTTLHSISNLIKKQSGSVVFDREDITNLHAAQIVHRGLIHVPEGRRIFANLSVKDNLEMGAYTRNDKEKIKQDMEHVFELFPRMKERLKQLAGTLSGGEQQMLAMGRGLMANPKLLLLDEPSMGLAPILVDEIFEIIKKINEDGTTILLVEQNAFKAMSIANRVYILETGSISSSGNSSDMIKDPAVKAAYLGG
ncbi:ABC transporter ATP-binding protein [Treponema berlinense]|uniref:ABC transporter ATP-binding protein n=1 Tax=Treponema berlinense TaxID=225004 RepID=UPI0023A89A33|nr:ABC transporter ATP-binding protein [Treponema berlinense]